jgi:cation transport ATPase
VPDYQTPSVPSTYSGLKQTIIAGAAGLAIAVHLVWRGLGNPPPSGSSFRPADVPLLVALVAGGGFLVFGLIARVARGEFGSDLLAGISIVTSVVLGEYLAGTLVVLMLSGGEALEAYAVRRASSALAALARRMPSVAHPRRDGTIHDVPHDAAGTGRWTSRT